MFIATTLSSASSSSSLARCFVLWPLTPDHPTHAGVGRPAHPEPARGVPDREPLQPRHDEGSQDHGLWRLLRRRPRPTRVCGRQPAGHQPGTCDVGMLPAGRAGPGGRGDRSLFVHSPRVSRRAGDIGRHGGNLGVCGVCVGCVSLATWVLGHWELAIGPGVVGGWRWGGASWLPTNPPGFSLSLSARALPSSKTHFFSCRRDAYPPKHTNPHLLHPGCVPHAPIGACAPTRDASPGSRLAA